MLNLARSLSRAVADELKRRASAPQKSHAQVLGHRLLDAVNYDFGSLWQSPPALAVAQRGGVRVVILPTDGLPEAALESLLAWRLGQYLLVNFYDAAQVEHLGWQHEPRHLVGDDDLHALAIDRRGALLCYLTVKQPHGIRGRTWGEPDRACYPLEEVHGRAWQRQLIGLDGTSTDCIWEWARFCKDQRRGRLDPTAQRAPLELGLTLVQFIQRPAFAGRWRIAVGDFDPNVALRMMRYFFVPAATFAPHYVTLEHGQPLAPRYALHPTAPFVATTEDIDETTYLRWLDIEYALAFRHRETARRLLALRQLVSIKESRLKQPIMTVDPGPYPRAALASASSRGSSAALWAAAEEGRLAGWRALALGPGQFAATDRVIWVVDGYLQAFIGRHEENGHLGGMGAEVAYVPQPCLPPVIGLRAASPAKVLVTDRPAFEDFWKRRQQCFESSTNSLYGAVTVEAGR